MKRARATATMAELIAAKLAEKDMETLAQTAPTILKFTILGEPIGKERARVFSNVNGNGTVVTRAVTPEKTRTYESMVKAFAKIAANQAKWAWSKNDVFTLLMRIYTTHRKRHPDASNVLKACEDACNGVVWRDDVDVTDIAIMLRQDAARPRVEVEVRRRARAA